MPNESPDRNGSARVKTSPWPETPPGRPGHNGDALPWAEAVPEHEGRLVDTVKVPRPPFAGMMTVAGYTGERVIGHGLPA